MYTFFAQFRHLNCFDARKLSPPANETQVKAGAQSAPLSDNLRFRQKQKLDIFLIIQLSISIGLIRVTQLDFKTFLIFNMNVMTDRKQFEHNRSSHRTISSLHSSVGLLDEDRKRVVLSVEGWSKFRTQHSSPDLNH